MTKQKTTLKKLLTAVVSTAMLASSFTMTTGTTTVSAAESQNYAEALELSLYFFDSNMCGTGVTDGALTWRGDCHTYDADVSLSSAVGLSSSSVTAIKAQNGGSDKVDVSGGYHDAGDHIKFSMTMGFSASCLGWSYFSYPESYKETGTEAHLKYILKNACDYFMKVTYLDSSDNVIAFCYQVASEGEDHSIWSAPEVQTMNRTTYWADSSHASANSSGQMAAALATTSLAFKDSDPAYSAECLKYAKALQTFTAKYPQTTGDGFGSMYNSQSINDDIAWSELWCALAGNDGKLPSSYNPTYKLTADGCYNNSDYDYYMFNWDKVWSGYATLLAEVGYDTATYVNELKFEINHNGGLTTSKYNTNGWGTSRYNCALQMMALRVANETNDTSYAEAAKYQMDYILGNNPYNMSFLIGYGNSWPVKIHHRAANPGDGDPAHNTDAKYTNYGMLVGGPDGGGYQDEQNSYQYTEPAIDYNGCFALAIAGIYARYGGDTTTAKTVIKNADEINDTFDFGGSTVIPSKFSAKVSVVDYETGEYIDGVEVASSVSSGTISWNTSDENPKTLNDFGTEKGTNYTVVLGALPEGYSNVKYNNYWDFNFLDSDSVEITISLRKQVEATTTPYTDDVRTTIKGTIQEKNFKSDSNFIKIDDVQYWLVKESDISSFDNIKIDDNIEIDCFIKDGTTVIYSIIDVKKVETTVTLWGDANCDGDVDMGDAVAILKYLADPVGCALTEQGKLNGDVNLNGNNIDSSDALAIQKLRAKQISELPESYYKG